MCECMCVHVCTFVITCCSCVVRHPIGPMYHTANQSNNREERKERFTFVTHTHTYTHTPLALTEGWTKRMRVYEGWMVPVAANPILLL